MQRRAGIALSLFVLGMALPLAAQDVPNTGPNQFEIGGFGGFSYGVDHSRAMGGGNVTYSVTNWLLPYAEVSYFPSIQRTYISPLPDGSPDYKEVFDIPLADVNFGVHIRKRLPHTQIVPYVVAGIGVLHSPVRTENRYDYEPNTGGYSTTATPVPVPASSNFAANFGGGIRYYVTERFGFRAETKGYLLSSGPLYQTGRWVYRATFGVFIQFR
ncbi:MAG: hypothetical protein ABSG56_22775 [Bryobacteraceae bacterium]|jgi:hypothetical protein